MGSLHYSRGNYDISNDYYERAAAVFKAIGNTDRYISAKMNQVWYHISTGEQDAALTMLKELDYSEKLSDKALSYIYNAYCGYYTVKKEYTKAIEYAKRDFALNNVPKTPEDSAAHYFSLIKNYCSLISLTVRFTTLQNWNSLCRKIIPIIIFIIWGFQTPINRQDWQKLATII
jgi:tetratricopeptide (TPR) repeat protein